MAVNNEEYINKMYDSSLSSQKEALKQNYDQGTTDLEREQQKQQKATDANLTRTYVEANKAAKNYNEVQHAYGLTSGAMAQARLAQDNQLQGDLTAIRAAQQSVDADIERQRTLLSQQYASAIAKAQADNDLQRAQALYAAAKEDEDRLLQQQKEAGNLMASVGDFSILANIYGLTPEQLALLQGGGTRSGGWDPMSDAVAGYWRDLLEKNTLDEDTDPDPKEKTEPTVRLNPGRPNNAFDPNRIQYI